MSSNEENKTPDVVESQAAHAPKKVWDVVIEEKDHQHLFVSSTPDVVRDLLPIIQHWSLAKVITKGVFTLHLCCNPIYGGAMQVALYLSDCLPAGKVFAIKGIYGDVVATNAPEDEDEDDIDIVDIGPAV